MVGAVVIGFLPEVGIDQLVYGTCLEPYSPAIFLVALALGFLVNRSEGHRVARFVWVAGMFWLLIGVLDTAAGWEASWSHQSRFNYVIDNLFGATSKCSGSECLGELL